MKILLVDDDLAVLMVMSMALEQVPHVQVIQAQNGGEALRLAAAEMPDAILLDVILPDLTGADVLQRLQANPATRAIPVVVHTAKSNPSDIRAFMDLGARGVIAKPFNPLKLYEELEKILNKMETGQKKRAGP